jgi:hypothetical protein
MWTEAKLRRNTQERSVCTCKISIHRSEYVNNVFERKSAFELTGATVISLLPFPTHSKYIKRGSESEKIKTIFSCLLARSWLLNLNPPQFSYMSNCRMNVCKILILMMTNRGLRHSIKGWINILFFDFLEYFLNLIFIFDTLFYFWRYFCFG